MTKVDLQAVAALLTAMAACISSNEILMGAIHGTDAVDVTSAPVASPADMRRTAHPKEEPLHLETKRRADRQ